MFSKATQFLIIFTMQIVFLEKQLNVIIWKVYFLTCRKYATTQLFVEKY